MDEEAIDTPAASRLDLYHSTAQPRREKARNNAGFWTFLDADGLCRGAGAGIKLSALPLILLGSHTEIGVGYPQTYP
ncbi:MAG: hypothetical protein IJI03_15280 [Rudaea sp.]|nr:hypothetical protein [Rudaea sp.]